MGIFQPSKAHQYFKIQSAKGSEATIAGANAIQPTDDSGFIEPRSNLIERGLRSGSRWPSKQAIVGRWGETGSPIIVELRGSGVAGTAPEFSPLIETLLGSKISNAADVIDGAGTTTTFTSTTETFVAGQLARVEIGSGYEIRRVLSVDGKTCTVQRAFSEAPADGDIIAAGITYLHLGTETEQYMTADQYLDGMRLYCVDTIAESMSVGVDAEDIIRASFGLRSLSCVETLDDDPHTPVFDEDSDNSDYHTGPDCQLIVDGSAIEMQSIEYSLTTRRSRSSIGSGGYLDLPWKGKFEDAVCTMKPFMENKDPITDFFSGTLINAEMTSGTTAGNIVHSEVVDLQRTGPTIDIGEDDFSWDDPTRITGGVYIGLF